MHRDALTTPLQIISYTLREIKDEESYMESMGQSRTSEVQRDARIGEAECNRQEHFSMFQWFRRQSEIKNNPRDCLIETALAEETRLEAKLLNDTEIELYKVGAPFKQWSRLTENFRLLRETLS